MPTIADIEQENEGQNPFTDPGFNNCLAVNDIHPDDLAEQVGLSIDDGGGGGGGEDEGGGDSGLWIKRGKHIYNKNYREGCVAMGTKDPNEDYIAHVEGDMLVRARASGVEVWHDVVGRDD